MHPSIVNKISHDLMLPKGFIYGIIAKIPESYRRIVLNTGRVVYQPSAELRLLQYWLVDYILNVGNQPLNSSTAYEIGNSIKSNAIIHKNSTHLLHMDVRNFFPSIGRVLLEPYFKKDLSQKLSDNDINFLLQIALWKGGLVMGAPSSPFLANRAMIPLDHQLEEIAKYNHLMYTRYSDDIIFSSKEPIAKSLVEEVENVLGTFNLRSNKRKTRFMGPGDKRVVTGLVVGDGAITLGGNRKKDLRRRIYKFMLNDKPTIQEALELLGHIQFAYSIEPHFVNKILVKYGTYNMSSESPSDVMIRIKSILEGAQ